MCICVNFCGFICCLADDESSMSPQCHTRASRSDRSWCYLTNLPSECHSLSGLNNTAPYHASPCGRT